MESWFEQLLLVPFFPLSSYQNLIMCMSYCLIATLPRWRVIVLFFFPEFLTRYGSFGKRLLGPIQQARMCLSCRSQMYVLYRKLEDFALILYRFSEPKLEVEILFMSTLASWHSVRCLCTTFFLTNFTT